MMAKWEHYAFSREITERVVAYLKDYGCTHGFTDQLTADLSELEGALAEDKY